MDMVGVDGFSMHLVWHLSTLVAEILFENFVKLEM